MRQSQLPDFLDITYHKKPALALGLSEYLRDGLIADKDELIAVDGVQELAQKLNDEQILWLDLEIDPKTNQLIDGALMVDGHYWRFDKGKFDDELFYIYTLIDTANHLGGHNIIEFDLLRLVDIFNGLRLQGKDAQTLKKWQSKTYDTLILSCLLIPHQPSHALTKLYKKHAHQNNPVIDCLESRMVFKLCLRAWQHLLHQWQAIFYALLPPLAHLNMMSKADYFGLQMVGELDWQALVDNLPKGNYSSLVALIKNHLQQNHQSWQNLGVACFISWLRYFNKPQARRPVWITKHITYKLAFLKAESLFWCLDDFNEKDINHACEYFFNYPSLRDGQMSIVRAIFKNQDLPLGILPTGGGKSLSFQLPALILSKYRRDLTIIISPLKALIEDQVMGLCSSIPIEYTSRIAYLTSGQTPQTQQAIINGVWQGDIDILYLSPERLKVSSIRQLLKHRQPAFWVLDEAHTLSQWGTDFRPDFLRIAEHILACYKDGLTASNDAPEVFNPPRVALVTATASQRVKDDLNQELIEKLNILTANKPLKQYGIESSSLKVWRDNIKLHFENIDSEQRLQRTFLILSERKKWYQQNHPTSATKGVALVYLRSRKGCEEYANKLKEQGLVAAAYHGKLHETQKKQLLEQFKNHELEVVVCTNAFGMGIDKEGIHTVIHSGVPNNLESYIQEIGRGARKPHETAHAYMLWSDKDIERQFFQEKKSRIPNSKTLNDCWGVIRPVLRRPVEEQWFVNSSLAPILDMDDTEELNTQIRVALLALERHGLLIEKEQQPIWVSIKLLKAPSVSDNQTLFALYSQLYQTNQQTSQATSYYLPELAMALGYSVKSLLKQLKALVDLGFAQWEVVLSIRAKYRHAYLKQLFNKAKQSLHVLQTCVLLDGSHVYDEMAHEEYLTINERQLDIFLKNHHHAIKTKDIFKTLKALGLFSVRGASNYWYISLTKDGMDILKQQALAHHWQDWLKLSVQRLAILERAFEFLLTKLPNDDPKNARAINLRLTDIAHALNENPDDVLKYFDDLQRLNIIDVSNLEDDGAIFFVSKSHQNRYHESAYKYLKEHYDDRCVRIHVLNAWLKADMSIKRQMLEDYFAKPLMDVVKAYGIDKKADITKPYLTDYQKQILPKRFSAQQTQIVTDASRASMVLAGPGSGKTTIVVHRVAYLLIEQNIAPEKMLILAYNRLAVHELRQRLFALVGHQAIGVTIETFHGLARQITGLTEKDAPQDELAAIRQRLIKEGHANNKTLDNSLRYQWLIETAINSLKESPQFYQYIMVDEFQDVDAYQYELIGLLADLHKEDDVDDTADLTKHNQEYEQRGYLMVVGDDDQNLYAWRGASIKYIQDFEDNYHLDSQQKFYLLNNYRSASNIVHLANEFIKILPSDERLKDDSHQIIAKNENLSDTPIRFGQFCQIKGVDMAHWLAQDLKQRFGQAKDTATIAVLAPRWDNFDAVQHYLQENGIHAQRYNEDEEQIIPINSVVGQALMRTLSENSLTDIDDVKKFLQDWQDEHNFQPLDRAWQVIFDKLSQVKDATYDKLLNILKTVQYHKASEVVLITYHSAKGKEFDHVYVIDDRLNDKNDNMAYGSNIRSLYVALTRAKHSLTILQNASQHHQHLHELLCKYGKLIDIPKIIIPQQLSYQRFLKLDELILTPTELVVGEGRQFIQDTFAKNIWGRNGMPCAGFVVYQHGIYSAQGQMIARFSKAFKSSLTRWSLSFVGFTTTLYHQHDLTWYERAGYQGEEQAHYLIIPFVQINMLMS